MTEEMEFRYSPPWPMAALLSAYGVAAIWLSGEKLRSALGLHTRSAVPSGGSAPALHWLNWLALGLVALGVLATASYLAMQFLLALRGRVRISRDGVAACDWRGRETNLSWQDVDELELIGRIGYSDLRMRARRRWFTLPPFSTDTTPLGEAIAARAGLVKAREDWRRAVYRRPATPPS